MSIPPIPLPKFRLSYPTMKFFTLLAITLPLAFQAAEACYQVHVLLSNDPFLGDSMYFVAKDNNVEVCKGSNTKHGASGNTIFTVNCGPRKFEMRNNGRAGQVTSQWRTVSPRGWMNNLSWDS